MPLTGSHHGIEHVEGICRLDEDLVAEVAGEARAADGDRTSSDLRRGEAEVWKGGDLRRELLDDRARSRPLHGQDAVVLGCVSDLDLQRTDERPQVRQVRLGRGEQELVGRMPKHDAVLEYIAGVIAPYGVLRATGPTGADVARHDAAEIALGIPATNPVLVQG